MTETTATNTVSHESAKASENTQTRQTPTNESLFDSLFTVWEKRTSEYFEKLLRNPTFLNTMGGVMNAGYKNKIAMDKALHAFWKNLNLPNKRDQERTLHLLNELHSRIFDLEEKLEEKLESLKSTEPQSARKTPPSHSSAAPLSDDFNPTAASARSRTGAETGGETRSTNRVDSKRTGKTVPNEG